jgi:hypothetical protein
MVMGLGLEEEPVFAQVADEWMVLLKVELGLDLVGLEESSHIAQAPGLLGHSTFTGLVDGAEGMAID